MTATHLPITDESRRASDRLLDALRRWREADRAASPSPAAVLRGIDAHRAVIEQAKGVLKRQHGLDSHQAFALMVRLSRLTRTPVHTVAGTLVRAGEGQPLPTLRLKPLARWLEDQRGT